MKWHGHAALVLSAKSDVKIIIDLTAVQDNPKPAFTPL